MIARDQMVLGYSTFAAAQLAGSVDHPDAGEADKNIYCRLENGYAPEEGIHQVEPEQAHQSPIEGTYYHQYY